MRLLIAAGLAIVLAACSQSGARGAGEVSPPEAKALEEAAAMLDERRLPPEALAPETEPPAPATGPEQAEMTGDTAPPSGQ